MAGILQGIGFEVTSLHEVVGQKGPVPAEGNCINISSRANFYIQGFASLFGD